MEHYFRNGLLLLDQGCMAEAVEAFTESIVLGPDATCLCYRGLAFYHLEQFDKAFADYDAAIASDSPSVPEAFYFRGMLNERMGNHGEAIIDLSRAIEMPGQVWKAEAYYQRATAFSFLGEHDMAIDDLVLSAKAGYGPARALLSTKGLSW